MEIEAYMDGNCTIDLATGDHIGEYFNWEDGLEIYMSWLKEIVPVDLEGYHIAVDLANGSATSTVVETLDSLRLQLKPSTIHQTGSISIQNAEAHIQKIYSA